MSTRLMTPEFAAALAAGELRPALLFEGEFASGFVRVWTGIGEIVWNGQAYSGLGTLLGVGSFEETDKIEATGTSVTLSGVSQELVAVAIDEARQGLPGRIWFALLDENHEIIADPALAFAGRLDVPGIDDGENTCTVSISYESRLIDLNRAREFRYTHESQQILHPGDRGFEYVTSIQELNLPWG
ncbi:hypothetical protein [Roseicyclus marinus]|uniref:hypothetical protein n=1 Tax=Roseicyclus marinus TaxID=2161673 RepID=UPI00240FBA4B|nr:hypothetical protein [Roseicyclus marinus]MDG3040433.1 hypothetical protein [Roseicyclus marinus]